MSHSKHSSMIRSWRARRESFHVIDDLLARERKSHSLKSPTEGHFIGITFTELDGDDRMVVRSSNWAAEYEPSGIFSRDDCRKFWKELTQAGFLKYR